MELIATCAFGLEKLVRDELKTLGLWIVKIEDGRVTFEGEKEGLIRANFCLRCADRVQIKMGEFEAKTFDELFDNISAIEWEKYIGIQDAFPIKATSTKSILHSEPATQSIVKKAIVTRLQKAHKVDILPENSDATYQIVVKCNKDQFVVCIDSSGDSLHKRGYRTKANDAPMKETLAASIIKLSDWAQTNESSETRTLIDPFCGSGTIPIEAALIAQNIAPSLYREFAFQSWPWIDQDKIEKIKRELVKAKEKPSSKSKTNQPSQPPKIFAFDIDPKTIEIAKQNAKNAGVFELIVFVTSDFNNLNFKNFTEATFITNPPYGERLEEEKAVTQMYKNLGEKFRQTSNCSLFLLTSREDFPRLFGRKEDKNRKLFNGNLRCYLYSYL